MLIYIAFFLLICTCALYIRFADKVSAKIAEYILLGFIVLFAGLRRDVGTDYEAYKQIFKELSLLNDSSYSVEAGYRALNLVVLQIGGSFMWVNILAASISSLFLFKSINFWIKDNKIKWLSYITFISVGVYFVYFFSGIRQGITIAIFLFASRFIVERRLFPFLLYILLGSLFHSSILFFVPIYWITRTPLNRALVFGLVLLSLVFAYLGFTALAFGFIIDLFTGGHYMGYKELFNGTANTKTGVGVLLRILVGLLLIHNSRYWLKEKRDAILYNIFCVGLISYNFFLGVDILIRISEYLLDTIIFVIPLSLTSYRGTLGYIYLTFIFLFLMALYYSNLNFDDMKLIPYQLQP